MAALPTLLTSRPQVGYSSSASAKGAGTSRGCTGPLQSLPETYAVPLRVRNTFIDTSAERSPSLERFYREREVSTCPSAHIGRLRNLFLEADVSTDVEEDYESGQVPYEVTDTSSEYEALPHEAAAASPSLPPVLVLSLAEALCPPSRPQHNSGQDFQRSEPSGGVARAALVGNGQHFARSEAAPMHGTQPYGYEGALLPPLAAELQSVPAPPNRPAPGTAELPSVGSAAHAAGRCKPCAFFHTVGCQSDLACQFCHLCEAGEKKRRRREKLEARRASHRLRRAGSQAAAAAPGGSGSGVAAFGPEEGEARS